MFLVKFMTTNGAMIQCFLGVAIIIIIATLFAQLLLQQQCQYILMMLAKEENCMEHSMGLTESIMIGFEKGSPIVSEYGRKPFL